MWRIGVDLGGTKIEAMALSSSGEARQRHRMPTPRGDYEATISAVAALVKSCAEAENIPAAAIEGIGIGIPGSLSPATGLVRNANSTWLNGKPLLQDFKAKLDWPVAVENDANCFALSEATDGAAAGCKSVFGIILGTGVGGGLIINGALHSGRNLIGGEWGHNPLPWPEGEERDWPPCYCGKQGCIETLLCGPALECQYQALSGQSASAAAISERARAGEPAASAALAAYARRLAKALAMVINIVDPEVIVFGGGLSNIPFLIEQAQRELSNWVFSDCCETIFKRNYWGDSSGVRGAARLLPSSM